MLDSNGDVILSQEGFIRRLKEADANEVLKNGKLIVKTGKLKTFYRRHLRSLIWALQTRFDIGFQLTDYATSSPYVLENPVAILSIAKSVNRIIKSVKARNVSFRYGAFFIKDKTIGLEQLRKIRIFIFSDA